jgi:hypothetical protein
MNSVLWWEALQNAVDEFLHAHQTKRLWKLPQQVCCWSPLSYQPVGNLEGSEKPQQVLSLLLKHPLQSTNIKPFPQEQ